MHEHRDTGMDRFKAGQRWLTEGLPMNLKLSNRPVRTRMPGGVAGVPPTGGPLCRFEAPSLCCDGAFGFSFFVFLFCVSFCLDHWLGIQRSLNALVTTKTLENAMAPAASMGESIVPFNG